MPFVIQTISTGYALLRPDTGEPVAASKYQDLALAIAMVFELQQAVDVLLQNPNDGNARLWAETILMTSRRG